MLIFVCRGFDNKIAKQKACESYQNITGSPLNLDYDKLGNPTADGLGVSIAHTDAVFLRAVSHSDVGIDIERKDRKISSRLGTIDEWTEMEAYAKYLGTGITKDLLGKVVDRSMVHKVDVGTEYIVSVYSSDGDIKLHEIGSYI